VSAPADTVAAAYEHCELVTRTQARNFSYGIRLLPGPKRRALSAVYAFARRIDDIGDGDLATEDKLARLSDARVQLKEISADSPDPVLIALADAAARLPIPLAAFDELIEGCEADVRGTSYETFDELHHYCRCVAGSIGRLSLGVFETRKPADMEAAEPLADALGVALQLTNILRDVREDRLGGRVYLPAADLERCDVRLDIGPDGEITVPTGALIGLYALEGARAESWYRAGLQLLPLLDRRSAACTAVAALRGRMSLPGWEKGLVAARALASGRA
jgi:phytoene synthase